MTVATALSWLTVLVGVILSYWCVRATLYFRHQVALMGGNWVLLAFYRTAITITAVAVWLTLARIIVLILGPQPLLSFISGLAIVWLLLVPLLLERLFRQHEGR